MPSAQDCAERLREQAYRTLLPQIRDLEQELHNISNSLTTGVQQVERKLEALSHIELPTTEVVLTEILGDVKRDNNLKTSALVLFAQSLRRKETQEEILALLLEAAQQYFSRTALFAVRGDRYVGWSSRGFADATARSISACSFPRSDSPKLEEVLEGANPVVLSGIPEEDPLRFLSEEAQGPYCLIPLKVLQRPVAILLGEGAEKDNTDELSILAEFTVLRLENIALKILYELSAAKPASGPQEISAVEEPAPEPAPAAQEAQWSADVPAQPVEATPEPVQEFIVEPVAESIPEPIPEPEYKFDLNSIRMPEPEPASAEMVETVSLPAVEEAPAPSLSMTASATAAAAEAAPAPEAEPVKVQPQEVRQFPEEEKLHSDAKRFARLLVSEIKLYNEHHVSEGRENRDLYLRLKRDIDRSRDMYEKRVSPAVSRKIDYFHDEIIRILGDNDPSTLGSDYPGPRVES